MPSYQRMPFGSYKGWRIHALPTDYLEWLLTIELHGWLADAVSWEYERRTHDCDDRADRTQPPLADPVIRIQPDEVPLARRVIDLGYRALARMMHPDVGGSADEMARLNLLAESLRSQMAALEQGK